MEQEEALWWSRGEKEVPVVRQEEPEDPEGPPKTESPKVPQVLEKRVVAKGPLRIEVPVKWSERINDEGDFPIQTAGTTPDKDRNDDGTRTAWTASTAWTVDTGNVTEGSHRMAVDGRFQPILLCEG